MADLIFQPVGDGDILKAGDTVKVTIAYDWLPFLTPTQGTLAGAFNNDPGVCSLVAVNVNTLENGAEFTFKIKNSVNYGVSVSNIKLEVMNQLQNLSDQSTVSIVGLEVTGVEKSLGASKGIVTKIVDTITGGNPDAPDPNKDSSGKPKTDANGNQPSTYDKYKTLIYLSFATVILIVIVIGIKEVETIV